MLLSTTVAGTHGGVVIAKSFAPEQNKVAVNKPDQPAIEARQGLAFIMFKYIIYNISFTPP